MRVTVAVVPKSKTFWRIRLEISYIDIEDPSSCGKRTDVEAIEIITKRMCIERLFEKSFDHTAIQYPPTQ